MDITAQKTKSIETQNGNLLICTSVNYTNDEDQKKFVTLYFFTDTAGKPLNPSNMKGWKDALTWGKPVVELSENLKKPVEATAYKLLELYERNMMNCARELVFGIEETIHKNIPHTNNTLGEKLMKLSM